MSRSPITLDGGAGGGDRLLLGVAGYCVRRPKTDVLPAEERGAGAAISVLGYRTGMLVSGGLALWLADRYLGWQGMYWLMAALLVPCIIATLLAPEPSDVIPVPRSLEQAVAEPLRDFSAATTPG